MVENGLNILSEINDIFIDLEDQFGFNINPKYVEYIDNIMIEWNLNGETKSYGPTIRRDPFWIIEGRSDMGRDSRFLKCIVDMVGRCQFLGLLLVDSDSYVGIRSIPQMPNSLRSLEHFDRSSRSTYNFWSVGELSLHLLDETIGDEVDIMINLIFIRK